MTHFIFDCDDVLLDWHSGFETFIKELGYEPDPSGPTQWKRGSWIGCSDDEASGLIAQFNASPAFGQLQSCEGATFTVWALRDAGHSLSVLTSCGDFPDLMEARISNLQAAFIRNGKNPFATVTILPLGSSKFETLKTYVKQHGSGHLRFVEDNFEHAKAGLANGIKSYCLRRTHNWDEEANDIDSGAICVGDLLRVVSMELGK